MNQAEKKWDEPGRFTKKELRLSALFLCKDITKGKYTCKTYGAVERSPFNFGKRKGDTISLREVGG